MGFSQKIREYFKAKNMTIREVAQQMDNYNESLVGRYMSSDKISGTFITKLKKYFPDIDINYMVSDDQENDVLKEGDEEYKVRSSEIIEEIEQKLTELKKIVKPKK